MITVGIYITISYDVYLLIILNSVHILAMAYTNNIHNMLECMKNKWPSRDIDIIQFQCTDTVI